MIFKKYDKIIVNVFEIKLYEIYKMLYLIVYVCDGLCRYIIVCYIYGIYVLYSL